MAREAEEVLEQVEARYANYMQRYEALEPGGRAREGASTSAPEVPESLASGTTRSVVGRATQREAIKAIMKTR